MSHNFPVIRSFSGNIQGNFLVLYNNQSKKAGEPILEIEVTNISEHGFWVMLDEKEYFLPFKYFPWFKNARIFDISEVERLSEKHLYWKNLNIDLTLDMIESPENYPLISR